MNKTIALDLIAEVKAAAGKIEDFLKTAQMNCAQDEFKVWQMRCANVLGTIQDELIRPICKQYPELVALIEGQDEQ